MISLEIASSELRLEHLRESLAFLDRQRLIQPSVNQQLRFDFQGLRRSYLDNPKHPDAQVLTCFGRIWIYDVALSIYADLKAGRYRQASYQAGRLMQLALQEKERGFKGLWHFSYNTRGDSFIDPRAPTGAVCWCLNALYAFILATGDRTLLAWTNQAVQEFLFGQQVTDPHDPRHGLVRSGLFNAEDVADESCMGYKVYQGRLNEQYQHVILEHNADAAGTFRLAFRATKRFAPGQTSFLRELIRRHDLLMQAVRRSFWQGDHFVSAMDGKGRFCVGTDGQPSVAVDNNTWAANVFLPYDPDLAFSSLRYVMNRFLIRTPAAEVEDLPDGAASPPDYLEGVYYFPDTFVDPFVQVPKEHRPKMGRLFQLEAAFGLVLFMNDLSQALINPSERLRMENRAQELYENTVAIQRLYGPCAAPYASANVPTVFTTLSSSTTAANGVVTALVLGGAPNGDFIGVSPPPEFVVNGQAPLKSSQ